MTRHRPLPPEGETWVHGTRLGREHRSVRQHTVEDHGADPAWARSATDGALHGYHDGRHRTTWAYAYDLPHHPDACDPAARPEASDAHG